MSVETHIDRLCIAGITIGNLLACVAMLWS